MKKLYYLMIMLCMCSLFTGCGKKEKIENHTLGKEELSIFYLNSEGTGLLEYKKTGITIPKDPIEAISFLVDQLKESPDLSEYKPVLVKDILVRNISFHDGYASLDFGISYSKQSPIAEILCRAALVKSLTQLDQVHNVEITVDGQPIMNQDGEVIGLMNENSFLDEDSVWKQAGACGEVTLYFADEQEERLVPYTMTLEIGNHIPIEQRIIEALIQGPKENGYRSTIPEGTKVMKTFVKSGICYVDFNEKFLEGVPHMKNNLVIYSVVNSLSELPTISKVQFTINGQKVAKYREGIVFDGMFTRNLDVQ